MIPMQQAISVIIEPNLFLPWTWLNQHTIIMRPEVWDGFMNGQSERNLRMLLAKAQPSEN
jgi:hypothetical protein